MSGNDNDGRNNPGGIRPDPDGASPRQPFTLDDAVASLQRRRNEATQRRRNGAGGPSDAAVQGDDPASNDNGGRNPLAHQEYDDGLPAPPDNDNLGGDYGDATEAPLEGEQPEGEHTGDQESYFTVTVGDQQRQVSLSELINGYMRAGDYTRKSSETAAQQKQFAEAYKMFSDVRGQLEARLARFTSEAAREFEQPIDWQQLARTNPMEWVEKRARFDALKEAEAEQGRLAQVRQQEDFARKTEQLRLGNDVLMKALPEWRDPAKKTTLIAELKDYARGMGYSDQELNSEILDPRYIMVFNDAMKYRKMQQRRVDLNNPPQQPNRQPMGRGGAPQASQPSRRQQAAANQFGAAPTIDNALALLKTRHKLN